MKNKVALRQALVALAVLIAPVFTSTTHQPPTLHDDEFTAPVPSNALLGQAALGQDPAGTVPRYAPERVMLWPHAAQLDAVTKVLPSAVAFSQLYIDDRVSEWIDSPEAISDDMETLYANDYPQHRARPSQATAVTCTVSTTADAGAGSLRHCLLSAATGDSINFNPGVFPPAAPATITLASRLPSITVTGLTIDASNAGVILNGSGLSEGSGLVLDGADGVTIRGLRVLSFPDDGIRLINGASNNVIGGETANARNVISGNDGAGIAMLHAGTSGNQILGNYIGTNAAGTAPLGSYWGVVVGYGAQNNIIGGGTVGARNVVSGNAVGVQFQSIGTSGNQVLGNYIGTDATGHAALGNENGIIVAFGASANTVGGVVAGTRNIISGNSANGVKIEGAGTNNNQVLGNYIGTDATGQAPLGNYTGIFILSGAQGNLVGGEITGARNIISGNSYLGIAIKYDGTTGNRVLGNYIGTNAMGQAALGNVWGVAILAGADNNIVGGETAGSRNIVSGNSYVGIGIQETGTTGNQVRGNYIGTDVSGATALGNQYGIVIHVGAQNNMIGGATTTARNVISGNTDEGIRLKDIGTTGNQVLGNYIGTNVTGTASLGNHEGVVISDGASSNVIGGEISGARNLISGNFVGVQIEDSGTISNQVKGNFIGTDVTGTTVVSNTGGVVIGFGAQNNIVGGNTTGARNIISGNASDGVFIQNAGTTGNQVLGNYIGTDATGTAPLGNPHGVVIESGAGNNIVGGETAGAQNVISGNTGTGVLIRDSGTTGNQVLGNYIGTDATGALPLSNPVGVDIGLGADNNKIGGALAGDQNLISRNQFGIRIQDTGTTGNQVQGNAVLTNTIHGVYLVDGASANTIGVSNTIAYNGAAGVAISGTTTLRNTITRNAIYQNTGLPIDFINGPVPLPPPSGCYSRPGNILLGNTCPNCRLEFFANPDDTPAGTQFLVAVTATVSGNYTVILLTPPSLPYLAATVTDQNGTTHEFSAILPCEPRLYLPLIHR